MKNKIKKIMATTILTVTATASLGCATTNTKIAQKINNGVNDFVSSINKLDYVDTNKTNSNIGKIVSAVNDSKFLNQVTSTSDIENTITKPSDRTDTFKLYTLSSSPYISLTSDDNNINLSIQFSTEKIESTSDDIDEKINKLILKRAILMVYVNEIYNGNVSLNDETRKAINAYVNVIKENASFLNGNRGMVRNQLDMASNLINSQSNDNIVNYYIIKSGEALEIRSNKIDSTISSIDSIISILENNLSPSSCYYQNNLTTSYENMLSGLNNNLSDENSLLAKNIAESINLYTPNTSDTNETTRNLTNTNQTNINTINTQNNIKRNISTNQDNKNNSNSNKNNTLNNNPPVVRNQIPENNTNNNMGIKTLEETEHNQVKSNNDNLNNSDYSKLTPSERARIRRQQRMTNNQNHIQRSTDTNATNPTMNPGSLNKSSTFDRVKDNQTFEQNGRTTNETTNTHRGRATRVPYKVSSNLD